MSALINPTVPPAELSRFLWDHLQLDVELLAKSLGRSVDETILCVHMILACMTAHVSNRTLITSASKKDKASFYRLNVWVVIMRWPFREISQGPLQMQWGNDWFARTSEKITMQKGSPPVYLYSRYLLRFCRAKSTYRGFVAIHDSAATQHRPMQQAGRWFWWGSQNRVLNILTVNHGEEFECKLQ